jgi:DNA polymerase-3 subunit alpha
MEMIYGRESESSKEKLMAVVKKHNRMIPDDHPDYKKYKDRLDHEIGVLADNGHMDWLPYILLIEDLSEYCKSSGILCNVRGSAGGSLILYLLRISVTDPIKYGLPFERFMTVERLAEGVPPDVDFDVEDRDPVIKYMREKYGDQVCLIANDNTLKLKSCILDTERATLGFVSPETTDIVRSIPATPQGVSDKDWLFGYKNKEDGSHVPGYWDSADSDDLKAWSKSNHVMWDTVNKALGILKTRGVHAGGVMVTPGPAHSHFPLIQTKKGLACAYNMKAAEEAGGLKYDILGVKTLKAISISLKSIKKELGVNIEWDEFPHDSEVYDKVINSGKLCGIFQISTHTMRPFVSRIKPKNINDLSLIAALVRPGSLDAPAPDPELVHLKAADYLCDVRDGKYKPYYIHQDIKHIFEETGGICIYQEQLLQTFRDVADYTYGQAEATRRAVGKKIKSLMEEHLGVLKKKCLEKGWTEAEAAQLTDTLIKSARYSFNKAHSASYGIVAYNGAWLKHKYPVHFWKGELTTHSDDHDKLREYFTECRDIILDIDIVKSDPVEWLIEGDKLRPPLSMMMGCGATHATNLKRFLAGDWDSVVEVEEPVETEEADDVVG